MNQPPPNPVIPFGKFKGERASEVKIEYLDWMIGLENLREPFKSELLAHLHSRSDWKGMDDE
jgi:hypothetical protein